MTGHIPTLKQIRHPDRREVLRIGGLTALGLGVSDLFGLRNTVASENRSIQASAKSCILIWLDGGASHLETFDLKPEAPAEIRGPLEAIPTKLPGVQISECLPETAKILDRVAIVRSVTSPLGEHNFGTHYMLTGYKPTPVLEYPVYGGVKAFLTTRENVLPPHIAVPDFRVGGGRLNGGGYLPPETRPFSVGGDPAKPDFQVRDLQLTNGLDITRLDRRRRFTRQIDRLGQLGGNDSSSDPNLDRAFQLITSSDAQQAFRLEEEPAQVRNRYGRRTIGQSCLLARRLIERGVPFVTVNTRGWDMHQDLYTRLKEGYTGAKVPVGLIPSLDLALSALVTDLEECGLLDETLIVVMSEFGRTPKLNTSGGRDHWPRVFSVALAGGGIRGGQVIGASDSVGESPADRPVTPSDLAATIYRLLGIDPRRELHTPDGRPVRISPPTAEVVEELIA
ncbi:MAG: DUF1501 domain-containing protein [Planctomycetes bacterium]|nr:DUF1501 domain-containing protein [Planctomycetota bacterium]